MVSEIVVFRGFRDAGRHVSSPFSNKLEARLRFAGLSCRVGAGSPLQVSLVLSKGRTVYDADYARDGGDRPMRPGKVPGNVDQHAPRGKIPYIHISDPSSSIQAPVALGDSTLIISQLENDGLLKNLNSALSPLDQAHDLALRALLEEKLYFFQEYEAWHLNYYTLRPVILWPMPYPVQIVVGLLAYAKMATTLYWQGTGRYTYEEISAFRLEIWESVNAWLIASRSKQKGDRNPRDLPFWVLGGDEPTEADATLFGFIASALVCTAGPDTVKVLKSFPAVVEYARRIHLAFYPDYALWD